MSMNDWLPAMTDGILSMLNSYFLIHISWTPKEQTSGKWQQQNSVMVGIHPSAEKNFIIIPYKWVIRGNTNKNPHKSYDQFL